MNETILHRLAKEIFQEINSIAIPPYIFEKSRKLKHGPVLEHVESVARGGKVTINRIDLETAENGFVPDVTLHSGYKKLFIEIAVTNKVKREKLRLIRISNQPAIEITLKEEDAFLSRDELRLKLQTNLESKKWLFHPSQKDAERNYLKKLQDEIRKYNACARPNRARMTNLPVKKTFSRATVNHNPSSWELAIYDQNYFEFCRKHKREPTDEESRKLWPQ